MFRFFCSPLTALHCRRSSPASSLPSAFAVGTGEHTITRCCSLSDRPDPAAYRVTIKRVQPPGASSSRFHDHVHEGDRLDVKAPAGHFFIDRDAATPAVLVAGGIGITPMMSMLRWCHAAPADSLHRKIAGNCGSCHAAERWKPATFDHAKQFVLDRDHDVKCATCHEGDDYGRYTCYGCHEHRPNEVRAEHIEEGLRNIENCVECHRSADEEPRRRSGRAERRERD